MNAKKKHKPGDHAWAIVDGRHVCKNCGDVKLMSERGNGLCKASFDKHGMPLKEHVHYSKRSHW